MSESFRLKAAAARAGRVRGDPSVTIHYRDNGGAPQARLPRDPHDFYTEPSWCVEILADAVRIVGSVLDPAAGLGRIPETFRRRGHHVVATDLIERDVPGVMGGLDFLDLANEIDNVITNPPYGLAARFIRHALPLARYKVAALVNAKFLYSESRHDLFAGDGLPLARILHLSSRPSMPPGTMLRAGTIKAEGGSQDFCWLIYDHDHQGPAISTWHLRPGARVRRRQ